MVKSPYEKLYFPHNKQMKKYQCYPKFVFDYQTRIREALKRILDNNPYVNKILSENQKEKKCEHEDVKLIGAIANTHLCFECGGVLVSNEIEILGQYYEIGAFCRNEKCKRFLILVA